MAKRQIPQDIEHVVLDLTDPQWSGRNGVDWALRMNDKDVELIFSGTEGRKAVVIPIHEASKIGEVMVHLGKQPTVR